MKKSLTILAFLTALALPLTAQDWSIGVGTGAFVFGDFVERRVRPVAGGETDGPTIQTLSAGTRPGLLVDIERVLSDRWAIRFEGAFTRAPLAVKEEGDGSDEDFELDAGDLDVATFMLPIVFRINTGGTFRFHIMGGPAYAIYRPVGRENTDATITVFEDTRSEWGAAAAVGAAWHVSNRFAVEAAIADIVTSSPFDRDDFPDVPGIDIPKPHNIHTTFGIRYRF
ncbi:MAG TPA: outer membrane beta-barrel protein [Thermoanaerobaculia bacterium]|nr:outer membrane beta-barrel protein [Thermoanaerobaculia bacterium]